LGCTVEHRRTPIRTSMSKGVALDGFGLNLFGLTVRRTPKRVVQAKRDNGTPRRTLLRWLDVVSTPHEGRDPEGPGPIHDESQIFTIRCGAITTGNRFSRKSPNALADLGGAIVRPAVSAHGRLRDGRPRPGARPRGRPRSLPLRSLATDRRAARFAEHSSHALGCMESPAGCGGLLRVPSWRLSRHVPYMTRRGSS
jgi:hypothetical protein